jgi:hypothetical protein
MIDGLTWCLPSANPFPCKCFLLITWHVPACWLVTPWQSVLCWPLHAAGISILLDHPYPTQVGWSIVFIQPTLQAAGLLLEMIASEPPNWIVRGRSHFVCLFQGTNRLEGFCYSTCIRFFTNFWTYFSRSPIQSPCTIFRPVLEQFDALSAAPICGCAPAQQHFS